MLPVSPAHRRAGGSTGCQSRVNHAHCIGMHRVDRIFLLLCCLCHRVVHRFHRLGIVHLAARVGSLPRPHWQAPQGGRITAGSTGLFS